MRLFRLIVLAIIIASCSQKEDKEQKEIIVTEETSKFEVEIDSSVIDSVEVKVRLHKYPIDPSVLAKYEKLDLDTLNLKEAIIYNLIEDNDKGIDESMSYIEVKQLTQNLASTPLGSLKWYLSTFYEIDSLTRIDQLDDYMSQLDIGMTQYSSVNPCGYFEMSDSTRLYLSVLSWSTMEACPYGFGHEIIGTVVKNDSVTISAQLGGHGGGGDPPASGSDTTFAVILKEGSFTANYINISGEEFDYETEDGWQYAEYADISKASFVGKIRPDSILIQEVSRENYSDTIIHE